MARRSGFLPSATVEALRLCVVVLVTSGGFRVAQVVDPDGVVRIGPFQLTQISILLGLTAGYVLGGVVARTTGRGLAQAEALIIGRSPEQALAAIFGTVAGGVVAAAFTWPLLLLGDMPIVLPIFAFLCLATATLGARIGLAQRAGLWAVLSTRGGLGVDVSTARAPRLIDTSVAIDGRIVDVVRAGFLHGRVLVPQPVLDELQGLADAGDDQRRAKGRRGLEVLEALRRERGLDIEVIGDEALEVPEVDAKLVRMALDRRAALLTLDSNLARVATLAGCRVMSLHALSLALRPPVCAGDPLAVLLTRAGKEAGQGVGHLDDGTMVVVERGRDQIGTQVHATVTSVLTTANGRLVFARLAAGAVAPSE